MNLRWCVMVASALMSLHLNAAGNLHSGASITIDQVKADRGIDPTYATGDPKNYSSFGIYGSFQASEYLALDASTRGAYNHHYDLSSAIIDLEAGIKVPFSVTSELSLIPMIGFNGIYTLLEAQSPARSSFEHGLYTGLGFSYKPYKSSFEVMAHYKTSTIGDRSAGAGIGFWKTRHQRLGLHYIDEGFRRKIRASLSFAF